VSIGTEIIMFMGGAAELKNLNHLSSVLSNFLLCQDDLAGLLPHIAGIP
jgi:hypothetical protein